MIVAQPARMVDVVQLPSHPAETDRESRRDRVTRMIVELCDSVLGEDACKGSDMVAETHPAVKETWKAADALSSKMADLRRREMLETRQRMIEKERSAGRRLSRAELKRYGGDGRKSEAYKALGERSDRAVQAYRAAQLAHTAALIRLVVQHFQQIGPRIRGVLHR